MARAKKVSSPIALRSLSPSDYLATPLAAFLIGADEKTTRLPDWAAGEAGEAGPVEAVFSGYELQDIADYRTAIRERFDPLPNGGRLIITVPHAFLHERQTMLPSRWRPTQRRLYTPSSLAAEIEEALLPNSYRLRWLGDLDVGYDYGLHRDEPPTGFHDVVAVVEKIAPPAWDLEDRDRTQTPRPSYAFEPSRTRIERSAGMAHHSILALKLDHLGDFIMCLPALTRLRETFPASEITLVVGPWNESLALSLGLVDKVVPFAAYPRNSSEEAVDVTGKKAQFDALITEQYDLAIDLRTDADTRFFLRDIRAGLRAGMGTKPEFPFLDIFLPIDITRHHVEAAWEDTIPFHHFSSQGYCKRTHFQVACSGDRVRPAQGAIVWGPYRHLQPGRYLFEPFLEVEAATPGLLGCDIALDAERVAYAILAEPRDISLEFEVRESARFEFRFQAIDGEAVPDFRFYGGRLVKQGASGVLHQSEYLRLLVELVALRTRGSGTLLEDR